MDSIYITLGIYNPDVDERRKQAPFNCAQNKNDVGGRAMASEGFLKSHKSKACFVKICNNHTKL